ncbi:MAG: single-stranded DNA-binding protein [Thermomicrobiales bacterium]
MSRGFSRVVLVGNLGRDPEMRYSQNGTPITNFSIAVNRRRRGPDGNYVDETDWYRITLFRNQAETSAEWLKKGSKVLVEGQLQIRTYTGQDGIERTSVDVNADNFVNLTARDEMAGGGYQQPQSGGYQQQSGGGRQGGGYDNQPQGAERGQAPQGERQKPERDADDFDDLDDVPF